MRESKRDDGRINEKRKKKKMETTNESGRKFNDRIKSLWIKYLGCQIKIDYSKQKEQNNTIHIIERPKLFLNFINMSCLTNK